MNYKSGIVTSGGYLIWLPLKLVMFLFLNKLLMSGTPNNIKYQPNTEIEGECLLKTIQPVKLSMPRFILFVFVSVILVGIPALLVYW